jgi:ABC-type dipeptide/oligopeptide/nickel transport system permease component
VELRPRVFVFRCGLLLLPKAELRLILLLVSQVARITGVYQYAQLFFEMESHYFFPGMTLNNSPLSYVSRVARNKVMHNSTPSPALQSF